jgi:hypothetical protein
MPGYGSKVAADAKKRIVEPRLSKCTTWSEASAERAGRTDARHFYFILHLLYDVMDIPFKLAGFRDGE